MASTVQKGGYIDYVAPSAVAVGDVVVIGSLVGVAPRPIASGDTGAVAVEGVYSLTKPSSGSESETITAGAAVYWYAASGVANAANATGVLAGYAVAEAVTGSATVNVKLDR